jgi:tetratricopeptide (TPR) repeat protein
MTISHQLLQEIADPTLDRVSRARLRCRLAKELEDIGNYEAAREAMGELWPGVGSRPVLDELDDATAAEVVLRVGVLTGWLGSTRQIEGAQEAAKNLISESIARFEGVQDTDKVAEAQMELGHCYWREGGYSEARVWLNEALGRLSDKATYVKAVTLSRLATLEKVSNRLNDALHLFRQAAPFFQTCANHSIRGRFHNSYANLLVVLGQGEGRQDYIDQALIEYAAASYHFEQAGHTRYQACVENNLGFLFFTTMYGTKVE